MRGSRGVYRVALTAVLAAVSLILLYLSTLLPTGRMGIVALAGLTPAAAVVSSGVGAGVLCYAGTGILALILLPDKGGALLYLLFFGLYPIVKYAVERLRRLPLELLLKLVFFNGVLTVFWLGLRAVLLSALPAAGQALWLVYAGGNVVFLLYDFGFSQVISFYGRRIDRVLRKGRLSHTMEERERGDRIWSKV